MPDIKSVLIKVPATTANLGPGFDCLGLALDIWNEIEFSISGLEQKFDIQGEGSKILPHDSSNLIFQSLHSVVEKVGINQSRRISINCKNQIPVSSGLGSSSSAVVAGLLGARAFFNIPNSDSELLRFGLDFEGHADNISACLLGGLTLTTIHDEKIIVKKISIQPLNVIIALPEVNLSTKQSRAVLPDFISKNDAIFNIARTALLTNALQEADYSILRIAMQDRIHQQYRLKHIPGAEEALNSALNMGAIGAALSGAGPSIMVFFENDPARIINSLKTSFESMGINVRIFTTTTINHGAQVIRKSF